MAKRFFYVCAGLCLLALSYHLGARNAGAQAGATVVGFTQVGNNAYVMTSYGDVYYRNDGSFGAPAGYMDLQGPAVRLGNFWGGATPAVGSTWGQVKSTYRK